ncbi:MAG TPA: AMP-binding protein [Jatrophihabitans sp.]|nr:AMP-binding protein [Jatrophihabitans sp.]
MTITVAGRSLERAALFAAAGAVADRVAGAGPVAIEATATLETVVGVLGCLLAGAPAVPVPPDAGPRERGHILSDSSAVWIPQVDVAARSSSSWTMPEDGPALIMYTSGTTGPPKGVVLSHRAVNACLDGLREAWAWSPDDVLVHGLPLFHVHGLVLGVLGALRAGSPLVHTGRPTTAAYAAAAEAGGTLFFGVPTVWGRVAHEPSCAAALRGARLLVSGSAALPPSVFAALQTLAGQQPVERYGMTETLITLAARADAPRRAGSVGGPIAGVEARLDGDGGLEIRGATLFDGYLGGPPVSDDGWFRTGDTAELDADGQYRILGRTATDLIKSGGYRIGAGEIEAVLIEHPAVSEAAVVGEPDDDLGQRIVAYVVASGVTGPALIEHVATQLAVHKRPREVRFVPALPRNALGKVVKTRL